MKEFITTMSIAAGLVGLPNVGKSTLFNALTKSSIPAENYPFCTIDPHTAITQVPDPRLDKLAAIYGSKKLIPATVSFVDIAGLVKGAASGEGLGNQFLSNIREVDLILHVLRCFEHPTILHTTGKIDPLSDYDTIIAELMLKDLESIDKRLAKIGTQLKAAQNDAKLKKSLEAEQALLTKVVAAINAGDEKKVRELMQAAPSDSLPLLSGKNFLIIANISEEDVENDSYLKNPHYIKVVERFGKDKVIPVCVRLASELSQATEEEAQEIMEMAGLKEHALDKVINATYDQLGLITFFTCGPKEAHAWPIRKGLTVRQAAGEIHSDLERGFICAEVFNCQDLFTAGSEVKLKETGKIKTEGQDYLVKDGDLLNVKFNV